MKKLLNVSLLISFILTISVPLTGVIVHKLASTLFMILCIAHVVFYGKKLGVKRWLLLFLVFLSFASGVLGMIFDPYPLVLQLHKVLSIATIFFLAIHIFVFRGKICKYPQNR